jgi:DNA-binding MarR family transcriptional regulator
MSDKAPFDLTGDFFQIFERISRLGWEPNPPGKLKPSEGKLLARLYISLNAGNEAIKVSDLSDQLGTTPAAVTHLVNPLEEGGYLERLADPGDRRVVLIGLTDKGKEFTQILIEDAKKRFVALTQHLGEKDSRAFLRIMSSIIDYFSANPSK